MTAVRLLCAAALALAAAACGSPTAAAAKDPMRCERDPVCAKQRAGFHDCSFQCVDNPECMDRCREMNSDGIGHPQ